jgi:hypothetical protein
MPKGPKDQKSKAPKGGERPSANAISRWENEGGATKKLPRDLPEDPITRGVAIMREAKGDKPPKKPKGR